jgi:DNA-binding transcriptional regulator GbsR (MarR family)
MDTGDSQAAREEVIEAMARIAEVYGLNRSAGQVYGLLYFEDQPLSLDELSAESGYAKSTVSTAVQKLERWHAVHRQSVPGEGKKAYYESNPDLWRITQAFIQRKVQRELHRMLRALESAEKQLETDDAQEEAVEHDLKKVRELRTMSHRGERLIDVLTDESVDGFETLLDRLQHD